MAATATTTQTHPPNPLLKAPKGPTRSKLLCFSFAAYSKTIIDHLKSLHIPVFSGLTDQEFSSIESTFHFTFPPDLRSILQEGLPVHPSFPNWRSSSPQQLNILLNLPSLSLSRNIRFHNFWSDSWGSKPSNTNDALAVVKDLLRNAPLLVPVYRNCYIPSTPNLSGNPVFYVDTEEIRILSFDITRFFQELELLTRSGVSKPFMRKKANSVNVNVPAWAATAPRRIEFWTEVEERGRRTVARGVTGGWWNRDEVEREGESRIGACMEEVFWRLREGGWKEEEVREMMMMIDGSDHNENKEMSRTQLMMDGEDAAWHVRVLSVVLLRAGWSREDVVYSLDLHDIIDDNDDDERLPTKVKLIITGAILTSFLILLTVIGLYYVYHQEKKKKESQGKIEKFLEDYKAFKPSRYSFADIKRTTNEFKDKLGQGGYGTVFKGRLSNDVLVAVKILNDSKGNGEEFINEVGSMSRIHHVNVTRLVGFCADGYKRALVYEYLPNESLEKFIFSAKGENHVLGWNKLQDIALGIAKGIEYLHQGCEQRILHFDIKPHNILLDQNFNPKISDFGLAKLCSKDQSAVSMTAARGTMGYIAPEVLSRNFGNVSYKSDVYSFGMLLLEMVGGRKNINVTVENTSQVYFPEWAYNHLDNGEETRIRIENESHSEIARKLTIVGLWCIQWYPVDRPSMKVVIQMLEGEADSLTKPPNPFGAADHMKMSAFKYKKPHQ